MCSEWFLSGCHRQLKKFIRKRYIIALICFAVLWYTIWCQSYSMKSAGQLIVHFGITWCYMCGYSHLIKYFTACFHLYMLHVIFIPSHLSLWIQINLLPLLLFMNFLLWLCNYCVTKSQQGGKYDMSKKYLHKPKM